jgi:hypothetical protein
MRAGGLPEKQPRGQALITVASNIRNKKPPVFRSAVQFGVILKQPAAGQAKEKFFFSTNFSSAAGETE